MNTVELLDQLQHRAWKDENLRRKLLATKDDEQPLTAFCRLCQSLGYEIYEMDVICAGEEFHAAMKRSTNGGGENSPKIDGEDDFYELFLAGLSMEEQSYGKELDCRTGFECI